MRNIFVDTSAFYAFLNKSDEFHQAAEKEFSTFDPDTTILTCSSYVILETLTLLQRRIGLDPVRKWRTTFQPILDVVWVGAELHEKALSAFIASEQRTVSLTDWTSFEIMQQRQIEDVFTFDLHFARYGFNLFPKVP